MRALTCFSWACHIKSHISTMGISKLCTNFHPSRSISTQSTQLHSPPPSSFQPLPSCNHLHPLHLSLHPALCNTLNNIARNWVISQNLGRKIKLSILTENRHTWYIGGVDSESRLRFWKLRRQNPFV